MGETRLVKLKPDMVQKYKMVSGNALTFNVHSGADSFSIGMYLGKYVLRLWWRK